MSDGGAGADGAAGADAAADGSGDADAALSMCGTATTGGSGDGCNTLVPTGPCVVEMAGTGPAPTPMGGTIVAGTYDVVSYTLYAAADAGADAGPSLDPTATREVSVVTGSGNSFSSQNAVASGTVVARSSGTDTTNGTSQLTFTPTCPVSDGGSGNPNQSGYTVATTVSGTTVSIFSTDDAGNVRVKVYQKR